VDLTDVYGASLKAADADPFNFLSGDSAALIHQALQEHLRDAVKTLVADNPDLIEKLPKRRD
jgi:hypothetical protein